MATIRVVAVGDEVVCRGMGQHNGEAKRNSLTYFLNSLTSCTVEKSWVNRMSPIVINGDMYESHSLQHKPLCLTV